MAGIFQGRAHARAPAGSQVNFSGAQDSHNLGDPFADIPLDRPGLTGVVNETAVGAFIRHPAIVVPHYKVAQG